MANQKDLVVKMTINSQDFDSGLKNAKGSMQKFNSDANRMGGSFGKTIGKMGKAFTALGIAMGAKDIFKSFITNTESLSDKWNIEIGAMKDGWKDFTWQVNTSNFSGFDTLISKARKAREELDKLGDATALFDLSSSKLSTDMEDLLNTIQKKKKSGQDYSGEVEQYNKLLAQYKSSAQLKQDKTVSSIQALFDRKGFNLGDLGLSGKGVEGYLELAMIAREASAGVYDDIIKQYREARDKTATGDIKSQGDWVYAEEHDYLAELQKEKGFAWVERARILSDLADITTEEKDQIDNLLKSYYATDRAIIQQDRKLNRYLSDSGGKGGKSSGSGAAMTREPVDLVPMLPPLQQMDEGLAIIEKINANIAKQQELEETNSIIMAVENMVYQQRIDQLNAYASALGQVGNMFAGLSSLAADGSPWQKFASALSGVSSEITGLISTYTSLVAIESVARSIESGEGIPFPYNLVAIAAAGAALVGIISSLKGSFKDAGSFASGGIVGGNSYSGDRLIAHVNSGEMIIPYKDWRNGLGGGNVNFVIEGSQLKGVLDNYNKTEAL